MKVVAAGLVVLGMFMTSGAPPYAPRTQDGTGAYLRPVPCLMGRAPRRSLVTARVSGRLLQLERRYLLCSPTCNSHLSKRTSALEVSMTWYTLKCIRVRRVLCACSSSCRSPAAPPLSSPLTQLRGPAQRWLGASLIY